MVLNPFVLILPELILIQLPLIIIGDCQPVQTVDKLLKVEILAVGRDLLKNPEHGIPGQHLLDLALALQHGQLEVLQKDEEPVDGHVLLLVLQPLEGHVLPRPEDVRAVVLED